MQKPQAVNLERRLSTRENRSSLIRNDWRGLSRDRVGPPMYVVLADALEAASITWDAEMLERGTEAVRTVTPSHWLEAGQVQDFL
jgi:hypothetical protein